MIAICFGLSVSYMSYRTSIVEISAMPKLPALKPI